MQRYNQGTILITALWMIAILAIFAVGVGRQSTIGLELTSYNVDRLKAYFVARAGIIRALAEKRLDYKAVHLTAIDALSKDWANNPDLFKRRRFGDGTYTVGYKFLENKSEDKENSSPLLYGLMDEESKININSAPQQALANLLVSVDINRAESEEIAAAIVDWRDIDNDATISRESNFSGAEEDYYQGLDRPYHCKNLPFDIIYELILVRGVTQEVIQKIKPYITVYGEGRVNINTTGERVLEALIGRQFPNLASKIIRYRRGNDEVIGTKDDRWFCLGEYVIERKEEGLVEIKNLQDAEWYGNIYGITTEEYSKLKELVVGENAQLGVSSRAYRAVSLGEVKKVKVKIEAVYIFDKKYNLPKIKFWYQE